jgi:histone H3/H4
MATTTTPDFGPPSTKLTAQPSSSEAKLASGPGAAHLSPMVGQRLRELVASLDPNYTLDAEAEEQLLHLADDFLEKVTKQSMRLAHHRGSKTLDVPDIQLALAKQWGIVIPGLGVPIMRPSKPANRAMAAGSSTAALSANSTTTETDDAKKRTAESVSNGSTVKKAKMEGVGGGAPASLAAPATGFR